MKIIFDIVQDWNLSIVIEIIGYEWLEQFKFKMGVVSLFVGIVVNMLF